MIKFRKPPTRRVTVVVAVLALLATVGGVAWAAAPGISKARGYSYSATYQVTANPVASEPQTVNWPRVGGVKLFSECGSGYIEPPDVAAGPAVGGLGFGMNNLSDHPVAVAYSASDGAYSGGDLMYPYADDPYKGERQFGGPGLQWMVDHTEGNHGLVTFAIMDPYGVSVNGTASWYFTWDPTDEVGRCAFTLQMKG